MINRQQALTGMTSILFVVGGIIGGGSTSPLLSMTVELIACALSAIGIAGIANGDWPTEARFAFIFIALVCCVPLLQVIPLPPFLSEKLPGREVPNAIFRLIGSNEAKRPLSLDPEQTRLAALTLIVPVSTFIAAIQLTRRSRDHFFIVVIGFAFVSALLGAFQVARGRMDFGIYTMVHAGYPIGFFANRNHEADLLLIAVPFLARAVEAKNWTRNAQLMVLGCGAAILSLSVVSTQSKTGISLLPIALLSALAIRSGGFRNVRVWRNGGIAVIGMIVAYFAISMTPLGERVTARFADVGSDLRPHIWAGTRVAIANFWPAGSGIGTFPPVYNMFEDLDTVGQPWVNHAHNDYLELLLVAGLPAAVLLIAFGALFISSLLRRVPFPVRGQRYAAVSAIGILLAHSATDYPLRTFALLTIFGFSAALLYPPQEVQRRKVIAKDRSTEVGLDAMKFDHD